MSFAQEMIQASPSPALGGNALAACIRAGFDRAQARTACANLVRKTG